MSQLIRLSSKLPGDAEINGLDGLHQQLCIDATAVLCYAWVKPIKVVRDVETEEIVPTVQLARIEPIGRVTSLDQRYVDDAAHLYEKRTGRNPLPIGALLAPKERLVKAEVAVAEMLMGMSPEDRDEAMSDGEDNVVQLATIPDGDVYVFDGEDYGDE
jgi:hypothetical protein